MGNGFTYALHTENKGHESSEPRFPPVDSFSEAFNAQERILSRLAVTVKQRLENSTLPASLRLELSHEEKGIQARLSRFRQDPNIVWLFSTSSKAADEAVSV